ncbi:TRAP transporter small permease [Paenibacillus hamazuiensis]|uniref:TRAP transporter small permease n=1 Tax=Paenibacillus hamazuiensis TaxID=2936508 RepID=UPI002010822D|nr:TRAP transporter small permease [Paenibacillus hamazuiensis]
MKFLTWFWNCFEEFIGGICLALMVLLVFANVVLRYIFNAPILWASEITLILFVWMIMFGIGAAARRNLHPKIEAIHWFLPERKRIYMDVAVQLVVIGFLLVLIVLSWNFSWDLGMQKFTGILRQRYTVIYLSMPIGFTFLLLRVGTQFILNIKSIIAKKPLMNQEVSIAKEVL